MIDLSAKVNAPAWKRVVEELAKPSADDAAFLARLLAVMGQVAGARQAVLFGLADSAQDDAATPARVLRAWSPAGFATGADVAIENEADQRAAAERAGESGRVQVLAGDEPSAGPYYQAGGGAAGGQNRAAVIATPVRAAGQNQSGSGGVGTTPVVTLLLDGRSEQALQTTVALVELIAGYVNGHASQLAARNSQAAAATLDLAATLIAAVNATPKFKGACFRFVNDLMRQVQADRVAIGWVSTADAAADGTKGDSGDDLKLIAMSDTEHIDRRMAMVRRMEAAMQECSDQSQPVLFPVPVTAEGVEPDPVLSQAVTQAHRELVSSDAKLKALSLPLRVGDRVLGVVTIETAAEPGSMAASVANPDTVERLQASMDLVAPVLRLRRRDDRGIAKRSVESARAGLGWLFGARHTVWKLAGVLVISAVVASALVKAPYRIEAPVTIEPTLRRTVSVPFTGVLASVEPGAVEGALVEAGQLLATLDASDLKLSAIEAQQQILESRADADDKRRRGRLAEAQQAQARADQARARLDLLEQRIAKAELRAPIAGLIIAGKPEDMLGASIELGQALVEIAPADEMEFVARVSDRDIGLVNEGQQGELATMAYPGRRFAFTVESVVPLARAAEGENAFEVHGRLDRTAEWMRPGMEGLAKFDTGDRTLLGIASRRIVDQARLWLWW